MNFSRNFQQARKKIGLTQSELADKLGVNQSAVANWESGIREPKLSQLEDIAKVLKVKVEELIR